ncbi:MAG: choice-of-anchor tandem repeat GloVer-containing protein, partial [Candidatus Sulfotelmatobacter sp.]
MQTRKFSSQLSVALTAIAMATLVTATCAAAQTEKVLYSFAYGSQPGAYPSSGLIFDAGNLYGATDFAGSNGSGAAFELTRQADGDWIGKSLYSFSPDNFGEFPVGLVFGASGHLYGVTLNGGTLNCAIGDEGLSCGTVFELTKMCGHWTGKILHDFDRNGKDGFFPEAGVIVDAAGNLYGTTGQGGAYGGGTYTGGTVFKLTPKSGGWTETILHNFGNDKDGQIPEGLTFDAAGNLYGITFEGGAYGLGTAFELTPNSGGWTETILH